MNIDVGLMAGVNKEPFPAFVVDIEVAKFVYTAMYKSNLHYKL